MTIYLEWFLRECTVTYGQLLDGNDATAETIRHMMLDAFFLGGRMAASQAVDHLTGLPNMYPKPSP